jgi:hypothetical protein
VEHPQCPLPHNHRYDGRLRRHLQRDLRRRIVRGDVCGVVVTGRNDGITINGDTVGHYFTDIYFHQVKVVGLPDVGLRIAGEVGGVLVDHADILENGENIRFDQSQVAVANAQMFFGVGAASDQTNVVTIASLTGSISGTTLTVSAVASGTLQAGNAVAGTSITGNPLILSQLTRTTGGVGTYQLDTNEGTIGSEALTTQGSGIGVHLVDPGLSNLDSYITCAGCWIATATNQGVKIDSTAAYWNIYFATANILNNNDYAKGPAMFDNESTSSGINITLAGVNFSQCCNGGKYAVFNAPGANPIQLQGVTFSLRTANRVNGSATGTWTDGNNLYNAANGAITATASGTVLISSSESYVKLTSGQNAVVQALAGNYAVIGAGSTNAYCGFWIGANVIPGYMDASTAGCALNLGAPSYPFSDIENKTQTINDPSTSDLATLTVEAPSDTAGVNLKLTGNGSTTPSKTIRVLNGVLQFANSAYTQVIASLTDAGAFATAGPVSATGYIGTGATPTVDAASTCSAAMVANSTQAAGLFQLTASCTNGAVRLDFATAAPNKWACNASDNFTATLVRNSDSSTSFSTFTIAAGATSDYINYQCTAFYLRRPCSSTDTSRSSPGAYAKQQSCAILKWGLLFRHRTNSNADSGASPNCTAEVFFGGLDRAS